MEKVWELLKATWISFEKPLFAEMSERTPIKKRGRTRKTTATETVATDEEGASVVIDDGGEVGQVDDEQVRLFPGLTQRVKYGIVTKIWSGPYFRIRKSGRLGPYV